MPHRVSNSRPKESSIKDSDYAQLADVKAQQASDYAQQAIVKSHLWQLIAPFRWIEHQSRLLLQHGFVARIKALVKKVARSSIRHGIAFINSHSGFRGRLVTISKKTGLYHLLRSIYLRLSRYTNPIFVPAEEFVAAEEHLSPRAYRIYINIKAAIAKRQKV